MIKLIHLYKFKLLHLYFEQKFYTKKNYENKHYSKYYFN